MVGKPKKQRKTTRKGLMRKLDKAVSVYVIARDKKCVVCGTPANLTCGHLVTRANYSTRWDLLNVFAQCRSCNFSHEFEPYPFINWYLERYGKHRLDILYAQHKQVKKWTNAGLEELLAHFENLNK